MKRDYVLITRPVADAQETAREVKGRGLRPFIEPMLVIHPLPFELPQGYDALAFTSANGVRVAADFIADRSKPVYCVGDHTAEVARACGWENVTSADGDAAALMALLGKQLKAGARLVHLSGTDVSRNIEVKGLSVERRAVYRAEKAASFSPGCVEILERGEVAAALFFSARTAEAFVDLLERHGLTQSVKTIKALCLADSVVKSLRHLPWRDVQAAGRTDRRALVSLLDTI